MKKIALIITLFVCFSQTYAQPSLHLVPEDGAMTLKGDGGEITGAVEYDVYRGTTSPPNTLYTTFQDGYNYEWVDTDVENGTLYYYRVISRDAANNQSVFSSVDAGVPATGSGGHALFDGEDDNIFRGFGNFLQTISRIRFDVRIDEQPSSTERMEIMRIENNWDQRPGGFSYNFTTLRVYHGASALVVEINVDNNRSDSNGNPGQSEYFSINTKNIADGKWHAVALDNIGLGRQNGRVFVDGTQYNIGNAGNKFSEIGFERNHDLRLGGRTFSNTIHFKGAIDNFKTFDGSGVLHDWRFGEPEAASVVYDNGSRNLNLSKENGVITGFTTTFGKMNAIAYSDRVSIRWDPDFDLPGDPIQSYEVWRKTGSGALTQLTSVPKEENSYVDSQVNLGETYAYEVRSVKSNSVVLRSQTDITKPVDDFDRYLELDGAGEVQIPASELLNDTDGTIEFWMKAADSDVEAGKSYSVLNKHDGSGSLNGFNFILDRSTLYVQVKNNANSMNIRPTTPISLIDENWHHVAFAYEWEGTSTLYIDGVAQVTENNTLDITLTSEPLRMGKSPASFWTPFKGGMDEVRIWDQVLTSTEINDRKDQPIAGDENGLQGVWRFDVLTTDNIAYDDGLDGYDGDIIGGLTTAFDPNGEVFASYDGDDVTIGWNIQSEDPITGYILRRFRVDNPSMSEFTYNLPTSITTIVDDGIVPNMEYEYQLEAVIASGSIVVSDFMATKQDLGNMLDFEQTGGQVEIDETITDNQQGTIEFRFRSDEAPPSGKSFALLSRTDATGSDNGFTFTHSATSVFVQMKAAGTTANLFVSKDYLDGEWHHMALVYDWNGENNLYIDGQLEATVTVNNLNITDQSLLVGTSLSTFWAPYIGQLDELRLWEKQLNSTEINASKDMRLPGNTTDLGAVWHFDELAGPTTYDNGSNNFDGTLSGNVSFKESVARLSFSSGTGGFVESHGNNGQILGSMIIEISGDNAFISSGEMDTNLYQLLNSTDDGATGSLFDGLTPILAVRADRKSAELSFNHEADIHTAVESVSSIRIGFVEGAFETATEVINREAETNVSYVLLDNTLPIVTTPFQEFFLPGNFTPMVIELQDVFIDPDFAQPFAYEVIKSNDFVNATLNGTVLTISPNEVGDNSTEITVVFNDGNGGEVAATYFINVERTEQTISIDPVQDIDLMNQSSVQINASSSSGLAVELELLEGDGSLDASGLLTINATGSFRISANQTGNAIYTTALEEIITFNVTDSRKTNQTITFGNIDEQVYGDQLTLGATASSGLAIAYQLTSGEGTLDNGVLTLEGIGTYEIVASQVGDDTFNPAEAVTQQFSVAKAALTVTADDLSIQVGESIPELTFAYAGFKLSDDASVLIAAPTISTSATASSPAGDYAIVLEGGVDGLYDLTLINGTLTLTDEPVLNVDDVQLTVYPNPVTNSLQVKGVEVVTMRLLTMDGKLIQSLQDANAMNVSRLKQGNYILQLQERNGNTSSHIIIKNN